MPPRSRSASLAQLEIPEHVGAPEQGQVDVADRASILRHALQPVVDDVLEVKRRRDSRHDENDKGRGGDLESAPEPPIAQEAERKR